MSLKGYSFIFGMGKGQKKRTISMILFLGNNPRRIIPSHSILRNERLLLLGESERFFVRFT
jgi:hypothetical protein